MLCRYTSRYYNARMRLGVFSWEGQSMCSALNTMARATGERERERYMYIHMYGRMRLGNAEAVKASL